MSKPSMWGSVRAGLLAALAVGCSPPAGQFGAADRRAVAAAVDSATRAFEAAERAQDADATIAHLASDFYMYNDGVRLPYDSVVVSVRRTMGSFRAFEPRFDNLEVRVLGPDAALATFTFRDSIVTRDGDLLQLTGPTTLLWQRRDAQWLISYADADHYPVSPP